MIPWNDAPVNKRMRSLRRFPPKASYNTSKTISRVLYLTVIYLDVLLPERSSHLLRTAGQAVCPPTVLLRIEFTASDSLQPMGELLPRLSTLTSSPQATGRYISVALFLKSPSAGVTRYPCPVEPGLSSWHAFRHCHATACFTRVIILQEGRGIVNGNRV